MLPYGVIRPQWVKDSAKGEVPSYVQYAWFTEQEIYISFFTRINLQLLFSPTVNNYLINMYIKIDMFSCALQM